MRKSLSSLGLISNDKLHDINRMNYGPFFYKAIVSLPCLFPTIMG